MPYENNVFFEDTGQPVPISYGVDASHLTYNDLVDLTAQNNAWSAEQAQHQMDFQREMYQMSMDYNANQAEIDRRFQQESADRAMNFSSAEAQANRDWQEYMSSTAHQRELNDLRMSGLNPILAAGNGASSGAGATANSAQAAGYGASAAGSPAGAKADADRNGSAAIASILGKMLDNQVELEKMRVSAETAQATANTYASATMYAAELAQAASYYSADQHYAGQVYSADQHYAGQVYAADQSYAASLNNPYNLLGHELGLFLGAIGEGNSSSNSGRQGGLGQTLATWANDLGRHFGDMARRPNHNVEGYIDTGGYGQTIPGYLHRWWNRLTKKK